MRSTSGWQGFALWGALAFCAGALAGSFAIIAMALWGEDL